tara:strand:+ start:2022 stop:2333 length:312 start_codon:yes stop_codon:yes gene_type:complete
MIDIDEYIDVDDVTPNGIWILDSGQTIDLRHVQLELPDGIGKEWVQAIMTNAESVYDTCPSCDKTVGEDSTIINLETHHYLIARCCGTWILIKNEEVKQEEWI